MGYVLLLLLSQMLLTPADVRKLLATPANAAQVASCQRHEERLRVHAEPAVDGLSAPAPGLSRILAQAARVLPTDKYNVWREFIPSPLPTTEIVDAVFTGLARAFEAQDGLVQVELATPELDTDFEAYRQQVQEPGFWAGPAFAAVRYAPHAVLVADLPARQTTRYPEPYLYFVELGAIIDLRIRPDASLDYLLFRLPARRDEQNQVIERAAAYCASAYRIFEKRESDREWGEPVVDHPHPLGYCPARLLWSQPLGRDPAALARRAPLSTQLGLLDRYVYWDASIEYYQNYGMFPIIWSFMQECTYQTPDGQACSGGFVAEQVGEVRLDSGQYIPRYQEKACPACARKNLIGPGTHLEVTPPSKDMPDTRNPVGMVQADVASVESARQSQRERRAAVLRGALGHDGEPATDQPRNEKDVRAGFEGRRDVLVQFNANLERAQQWALETLARLRYGPAALRQVTVNRGTEFYLATPGELAEREQQAKAAGAPVYELSQARELRYQTQYRTNPPLLDRMRILSDLEPWPEFSLTELLAQLSQNPALADFFDRPQLQLKANFGQYLTRFESEQADVRQFASLLPYHQKRQLILQTLLSYVQPTQTSGAA